MTYWYIVKRLQASIQNVGLNACLTPAAVRSDLQNTKRINQNGVARIMKK